MKHVAHLFGMTLVAGLFFVILVFVEEGYVLYEEIVPPADVTLEEWLESFRFWGTVGIVLSWGAALLWYAMGQWALSVDTWRAADKRSVWGLLALLALAGIVVGILLTGRAQEGAAFAYVFYFLNGLLSYYLATALFSPSSFKYTPIGASKLRRWNLEF